MNCSELENINISLDYFNTIKLLSDELIKYFKGYKQLSIEYMKKLETFHSNFKKKLLAPENPKTSQIISSLTSKLVYLVNQNIELFQISIDEIDLRMRGFDTFIKEKTESIKTTQKSSSELIKSYLNSNIEINKVKNNYLNSLSKTEDIINKYYSDQYRIREHENGLEQILNDNEYEYLKEQQKNELIEMENSIKTSKRLEGIYKNTISSSLKLYNNFVEAHNSFRDKIKSDTCQLAEEIKSLVISFMLSYKNNYKQPLSYIDATITQFNSLEEGKEIDKIINDNYKNDNLLQKITPINYKLKSLSILKEANYIKNDIDERDIINDNNTKEELSRKKSTSTLEDGFEKMEYITDESLIITIKYLFENFTYIDKEEFNIKLEENKNRTQKHILKIESNMNSYPFAKFGIISENNKNPNVNLNVEYKRENLSTEEISDLIELLDNHHNRIIFLQKLSDYRSRGKFYLCIEDFALLSNLFNIISDKIKRDMDYHCAEMVIILSETYCIEEGNRKKYLQESIKENPIYKDKNFWEEFLCYAISKEIMKTLKRDQKTIENKKNSDSKYSNIVFTQLLTIIDNMFEFDVDSSIIKEVIEPKISYYKLNKSLKNTINDVILSKGTQKVLDKEEKEKEIKKKEEEEKLRQEQKLKQEEKKEENIINDEEKKNGDENKNEKQKKDDEMKNNEGDKKNEGNEDNKDNKKKEEEKKDENKKDETTRQIEKQGWEFMEFEI